MIKFKARHLMSGFFTEPGYARLHPVPGSYSVPGYVVFIALQLSFNHSCHYFSASSN